jgi:hypothetical protein
MSEMASTLQHISLRGPEYILIVSHESDIEKRVAKILARSVTAPNGEDTTPNLCVIASQDQECSKRLKLVSETMAFKKRR